ncbi:MAG: alpha/beta fold hydrolase [Myxococcaceae bacterium]|nr:alpha/beta fold hydrolase [Myxococcaceae bacterium]
MLLSQFRIGDGPRAGVLLHGFLGSGRNLRTLAQAWCEADRSLTLLVPDLTGHGMSPPAPEGAGLEDVARDVLETAREAGLKGPLSFTGHSFGGRVSLAALRAAPEEVADVTLLDIAPGPLGEGRSDTRRVVQALVRAPERAPDRQTMRTALLGEGLSPAMADWLLMNLERTGSGVRWRIDRPELLRLHERVNAEDLWDVVDARSRPVRCVRGGASPYVTDEDVRRMESAGCHVHTLPGVGHYVHTEALGALVEWLTRSP